MLSPFCSCPADLNYNIGSAIGSIVREDCQQPSIPTTKSIEMVRGCSAGSLLVEIAIIIRLAGR